MKTVLLKLDDEVHAKLSELKKTGGYKSWEEFFASFVTDSEQKIKEKKKEEVKTKLYEVLLEAKVLSEANINVLELIRIAIIKILDNDKEKAREYLLKALDELNKLE